MIFIRIFALLALLGIGGSLFAWMWTGETRYRLLAWHFFRAGLVILLIILLLFAFERLVGPLG